MLLGMQGKSQLAEYIMRLHVLPDLQGCAIKVPKHAASVKAGSFSPVCYTCVETQQACSASLMLSI